MKLPILFALLTTTFPVRADRLLVDQHKTDFVIVVDPAATAPEHTAAHELASMLEQISGAHFVLATNTQAPSHCILVGAGDAAEKAFPDVPFAKLGAEELVIKTKGDRLLLAGGRPRGTLYAVSRFLQEECGGALVDAVGYSNPEESDVSHWRSRPT